MRQVFKSKWIHISVAIVGFGFFGGYLVSSSDWRFSITWALAFPAISFSVAWTFVVLKFFDRFPKLNDYLLHPRSDEITENPMSNDEWSLKQAIYLENLFRGKAMLLTPAEDGLICVPVLLLGIEPLSALLGGVVFGVIHLARFTYIECIGKSVTYALVCYFVLPHGLLTVVLGHVIMNGLAFVAIQAGKRKLSEKLY